MADSRNTSHMNKQVGQREAGLHLPDAGIRQGRQVRLKVLLPVSRRLCHRRQVDLPALRLLHQLPQAVDMLKCLDIRTPVILQLMLSL